MTFNEFPYHPKPKSVVIHTMPPYKDVSAAKRGRLVVFLVVIGIYHAAFLLLTLTLRMERIEDKLGLSHPSSWTQIMKLIGGGK
jgi:hypothetical protein